MSECNCPPDPMGFDCSHEEELVKVRRIAEAYGMDLGPGEDPRDTSPEALARRLRVECHAEPPRSWTGGPCNGDHREGLHHDDEGWFWGPVDRTTS